jgi:AraC-like DNA-binding protein
MILGGKVAAEFRVLIEGVFTRVMAGDQSLIEVINENAASNAPVQQVYRQALAQEPAVSAYDSLSKKRQLDMEELELQIEMDERKQRLSMLASEAQMKASDAQMKAADAQMKVMGVQKMLMDTYALLCPNQVMDDRARLLFKDNVLNIALQGTPARAQLAIEDGAGPSAVVNLAVNPNKPITISTLAAELGYRFDSGQLQKIGKRAAAAFREKYGESPSKHEQLVGQASIMVNSYTERDRKLLEGVIVAFINE